MNKMVEEEDLLIAKSEDKKRLCKTRNKITYSDFLNEKEQLVIKKNLKLENCFWFGGNENADRKALVFYPEKISEEVARNSIDTIFSVIRITLPNENVGKFEHRNYLSALIKIGIERSKIGDIIVYENGADIVVFKINENFVLQGLKELTRFRKSTIEIVNIDQIMNKVDLFEEINIIISSLRCDNIISELAKCSRGVAEKLIEDERVLVNYEIVKKSSKKIEIGDKVTIRGKGKFVIEEICGNTKNGNIILSVKKYL